MVRICGILGIFIISVGCVESRSIKRGKDLTQSTLPEKTTPSAPSPEKNTDPSVPVEPVLPSLEKPDLQVGEDKADAETIADKICANEPGSAKRQEGIASLKKLVPGTRPFDFAKASQGKDACVKALLPSALYANLVSGVPASTLVGQAVQETGWCTSELAKNALNFHGQKASLAQSGFTYWKGESYKKSSSESPTGEGMEQVSNFMKFSHADFSFISVAERFVHPDYPAEFYKKCMAFREDSTKFITCIGARWAVHTEYAQVVVRHIEEFKLKRCELAPTEWALLAKFK